MPTLQRLCDHFLMTHASGRPVMALMLAEQHGNGELFREASRFVLDQRECTGLLACEQADDWFRDLGTERDGLSDGADPIEACTTVRLDPPQPALRLKLEVVGGIGSSSGSSSWEVST